jgi:hypothetical protein
MKRASALALLTLIVAACGEPEPGASTTLTPDPATTMAFVPTTTDAEETGAEVIVTASAVRQPDGSIELCPPGMTAACPGIILVGEIDPALVSSESEPIVIAVSGSYDGRSLLADSPPMAADYPPITALEFDSLCPDLEGTRSVDPNSAQMESVTAYATAQPDYAALWWDQERAIFTIRFKSDDISVHQEAISELAAGEPVCVVGGADFSEAELMEASARLNGFKDSTGQPMATFGYSVGGLSNRIDVPVEMIDAETRMALADVFGEMVAPYPFIESVEVSLADLPEPIPVVAGDVEILTSRTRLGGGMAALGLFEVRYDPELNCMYFTGSEEGDAGRTVPVWPFGYSATSSPLIVYDYDGNQVGGEGDTLELGGGFVGVELVDGDTCGADGAWIVNR